MVNINTAALHQQWIIFRLCKLHIHTTELLKAIGGHFGSSIRLFTMPNPLSTMWFIPNVLNWHVTHGKWAKWSGPPFVMNEMAHMAKGRMSDGMMAACCLWTLTAQLCVYFVGYADKSMCPLYLLLISNKICAFIILGKISFPIIQFAFGWFTKWTSTRIYIHIYLLVTWQRIKFQICPKLIGL